MSKRLMPTYLVNFLKEIYDGTIPSNFGERMVSRQFIASVKTLYETLGGTNPSDYSRRMVNEYLIKFFNEIEIVEYTDDDVLMTKTISSDLVYPACRVDAIGGMSYVVDGVIQDSPVTAVKTYNTDNELLDTYTVPSAITSLEGYGQGINENCYNNVDFTSGKYIKKVGVYTFTGDETWTSYSNGRYASVGLGGKSYNAYTDIPNMLPDFDATVTVRDSVFSSGGRRISINTNAVFVGDGITNEELVGKSFYYELATPVETTISENEPLLECEDSGTIVFENEYNQNMPNEVTTWIKES